MARTKPTAAAALTQWFDHAQRAYEGDGGLSPDQLLALAIRPESKSGTARTYYLDEYERVLQKKLAFTVPAPQGPLEWQHYRHMIAFYERDMAALLELHADAVRRASTPPKTVRPKRLSAAALSLAAVHHMTEDAA